MWSRLTSFFLWSRTTPSVLSGTATLPALWFLKISLYAICALVHVSSLKIKLKQALTYDRQTRCYWVVTGSFGSLDVDGFRRYLEPFFFFFLRRTARVM